MLLRKDSMVGVGKRVACEWRAKVQLLWAGGVHVDNAFGHECRYPDDRDDPLGPGDPTRPVPGGPTPRRGRFRGDAPRVKEVGARRAPAGGAPPRTPEEVVPLPLAHHPPGRDPAPRRPVAGVRRCRGGAGRLLLVETRLHSVRPWQDLSLVCHPQDRSRVAGVPGRLRTARRHD